MFKFLKDIAALPVAVVADVVTLGGALNDHRGTYTAKKCADILEDLDL